MSRATELRALHQQPPLVLPNCWDAASARAYVDAGFPAVATSSGAVASVLGWGDHEEAPVDEVLAAIARITRSVDVPVTADFEAGYGLAPAEIVAGLRDAGAAGCNLEDTDHSVGAPRPVADQAERLAAVVEAAGGELVVNARVDTFLGGGNGEVDDAVERATAYLEAGADCTYPIGFLDEATVAALVERIPGPVNALCRPGAEPTVARLAELGVARITFGSSLHRAAMVSVADLAGSLRA